MNTNTITVPTGISYRGMAAMMHLSAVQIRRSIGTWVLLTILVTMAVSAPIIAKYTPQLLSAMVDPNMADLLSSNIGNPTWDDAYSEWVKNLNQVCIFALIIIAATSLHSHLSGGGTALILSRNIGRSAYLTAHLLTFLATTFVAVAISTFTTWTITVLTFGSAPLFPLVTSSAVWWVLTVIITTAMLITEVISAKLGAVLATGIVVYLAMTVGAMWQWGTAHTPLGLTNIMAHLAANQDTVWALPITLSLLVCSSLWAAAIWIYNRKDLEQ